MKPLLPRFSLGRWGGADIDGQRDSNGWSLAIQWGGFILEIGLARIVP